jgi:hypothetical protein
VFYIEGKIIYCILFLYEFDRNFNRHTEFYISPTQRLDKDAKLLFPRGAKIQKISEFLDDIFGNKDYSVVIKRTLFNPDVRRV